MDSFAQRSRFLLATVAVAGAVWSTAEVGHLVATAAVRFALPHQWPLFLASHLALAITACLLMVAMLEGSARLVAVVLRRLAPGAAWAGTLASGLALFGFHAAVWSAACLTTFPHDALTIALAGTAVLLPLVVLVRGQFPWRRLPPQRAEGARAAGYFTVVVLLHLGNSWWNPKIYFPVHVAGAVFSLTAALFGAAHLWRALGRPAGWRPLPARTALAVVGLVAVPLVFLRLSNDVRYVLFTRAFDAKSMLYVAHKLGGDVHPVTAAAPDGPLPPPAPPGPRRVERVLLLTIDTVRADHLALYGYHRDTAPHIGRFARQAVTFDWAWAAAAKTVHALEAIMHTAGTRTPLPAALAQARISRRAILPHGFNSWHQQFEPVVIVDGDDARRADAAVRQIEGEGWNGLLWVHFFDPHHPYQPRGGSPFGTSSIDLYDGELAASDRAAGRILEALDRSPLAASTAVILAADHGEEFGEHGGDQHGWDIHNELMHIPLLIRLPGVPARRVDTHVSQHDLAPTISELLGLPGEAGMRDHSLVPLVLGERDDDRVVMVGPISTFGAGALMSGRWKLAYCLFNDTYALYDLTADPGERLNLFEARPRVAARLTALLRATLADPQRLGRAVNAGDGELGWKRPAAAN